MLKVKKFVYRGEAGYELHFEDGRMMEVPRLVSTGQKRNISEHGDEYFAHTLRFSDGVVQEAVLSSEVATIPDCSHLM